MTDLSCNYLGLNLRNPIIIGSSGLTSTIENLKKIADAGAGAIVLKSIFEEQIKFETEATLNSDSANMKSWNSTFESIVSSKEHYYDEAYEYLTNYAREHTLSKYISLISESKKELSIPIIASINCTTNYDWEYFAKRIQDAGADALELNMYILPSDISKSGLEIENLYFEIIEKIKNFITIPIALKIGPYFSSLAKTAVDLSNTGIAGLTLFSRAYNPDIDIDTLHLSSSNIFSSEHEYTNTLRWVALLSGKVNCDIAASSGIHNYETIIKQLLAGAAAVQMVSVFYLNNFDIISKILVDISNWMTQHNFSKINDFKGLMSHSNIQNSATYERVQFIRLYSSIE